ncbi:MAG: LacI family DNA-binding transcriptional regulator [Candidatus Promineifilaceae bacterium]
MGGKVTITDVARTAEVSVSTVSNLLNGRSKRMRPQTQDRIRHAIKTLGYTPNQAARQLKTGHARIVGLIVPSVANPFYGVFARHVEKTALANGYQVLLCNSERDPDRERAYAEELWGYGVRGIIFGSSLMQFSHLDDLIERGLNLVAFDRLSQEQDRSIIDSIGVDNIFATRLAVKHLLSLGHRRIAFLSGHVRTVSRTDRLNGYLSALHDAGIEPDEQLIWRGKSNGSFGDADAIEMGRQGAHALFSQTNPPTAVFAINDMYAFGVYAGAGDLGLSIPDDVSIVGMDDIMLTEVVRPPLTTIRQPIAKIAQQATERLLGRLQETYTDPQAHIVLTPRLIVRGSTAKLS